MLPEQIVKLNHVVVETETKQYGTVGTLCRGHFKTLAKMTNAESKQLEEIGVSIEERMSKDIRDSKIKSLKECFASIPEEKRELVLKLIDKL